MPETIVDGFSMAQFRPNSINILLVDDHPLFRAGIRSVLEQYSDIRIVGEACNGVEAVAHARTLNPHVIIMDVNMPQMDGV
jgi:DNA-binding NarL/FixJ family response regulator